jgi:alginate O-acetyltransferase complex protein AlgJ
MNEFVFQRPIPTRRKTAAAVGMAAVLVASVPVNWVFLSADGGSKDAPSTFVEDWLRGGRTAEVTRLYNERFALKDAGIDLFGTLSYVAFGEGRDGVLIGSDGWLFSKEEFQTDKHSRERLAANLALIAQARDALAARGVRLVTTIVPSKADIYPEELGRYRWPAEPASRYDAIVETLTKANVPVVDLRPALQAAKSEAPVFLKTDTHWTPYGANAAAEAVAMSVATLPDIGEPAAFTLKDGEAFTHSGDLMRYVRLGFLEGLIGPKPDEVVPHEAVGGDAGDLFGDAEIPIALVGTSYSADKRWGFEASLKAALSRDVVNVAEEGKGPFEPMAAFLAGETLRDAPPKVVVWELPERYLDDVVKVSFGGAS